MPSRPRRPRRSERGGPARAREAGLVARRILRSRHRRSDRGSRCADVDARRCGRKGGRLVLLVGRADCQDVRPRRGELIGAADVPVVAGRRDDEPTVAEGAEDCVVQRRVGLDAREAEVDHSGAVLGRRKHSGGSGILRDSARPVRARVVHEKVRLRVHADDPDAVHGCGDERCHRGAVVLACARDGLAVQSRSCSGARRTPGESGRHRCRRRSPGCRARAASRGPRRCPRATTPGLRADRARRTLRLPALQVRARRAKRRAGGDARERPGYRVPSAP